MARKRWTGVLNGIPARTGAESFVLLDIQLKEWIICGLQKS